MKFEFDENLRESERKRCKFKSFETEHAKFSLKLMFHTNPKNSGDLIVEKVQRPV